MKKTIYETREYILKDLAKKHSWLKFNLQEVSEIAHTLPKEELLRLDSLFVGFDDQLNTFFKNNQ